MFRVGLHGRAGEGKREGREGRGGREEEREKVCVCVCVCVCVRERERERERERTGVCVCVRQRKKNKCIVCLKKRGSECVGEKCVCMKVVNSKRKYVIGMNGLHSILRRMRRCSLELGMSR